VTPFPPGLAEGDASLTSFVQESLPASAVTVARAAFGPGAATTWHRHEGPQLLVFVDGPGFVDTEVVDGEGTERVEADGGDSVWCSAGVWHRHGAGPSAGAVHISTTWGGTQWRA
jgi:quercetin dioxygenase-like cupin family protein